MIPRTTNTVRGLNRTIRSSTTGQTVTTGPDDVYPARLPGHPDLVSLRSTGIEQSTLLPDGRPVVVWVGVPDDPYIDKGELDTVALEVRVDDEVAATLDTVLAPSQDSEARRLVRAVASGLEDGSLEPTAGDLEPLADTIL
jgi:hypothetical protein